MLLPAPAASRSVMLVYATARCFWGWGCLEAAGQPLPLAVVRRCSAHCCHLAFPRCGRNKHRFVLSPLTAQARSTWGLS